MEKIRRQDRECPLSATLGLVGEWWTLLILHDAFDGYTRFDEFQANLGISSSLLTSRLKRLVENGLLERRRYQELPPRFDYHLTELGRSLRPVIVVLAAWGNSRLAPDDRSMILVDAETGAEAEPVVVDRDTMRPVDGPAFVFAAGPAASKPFRDRYRGRPAVETATARRSTKRSWRPGSSDRRAGEPGRTAPSTSRRRCRRCCHAGRRLKARATSAPQADLPPPPWSHLGGADP